MKTCCFCEKEMSITGIINGDNGKALCQKCVKNICLMVVGRLFEDAHTHPKPKQEDPIEGEKKA